MFRSRLAPALAFVIISLAAGPDNGQWKPQSLTFHSGQSMYIVAFRTWQFALLCDQPPVDGQRYFKEQFDLDALRNAAFGRYVIGPLKLPTLSRLSDRLVKQFREKVGH